jgi:hypothetical protein
MFNRGEAFSALRIRFPAIQRRPTSDGVHNRAPD